MTLNFPGPYEVRIFYTVDATPGGVLEHVVRLNCSLEGTIEIGQAFSTISLEKGQGGVINLSLAVDAYIEEIKPFFSDTDAAFNYAELWHYYVGTFDAEYKSAYTIGENGSNGGAVVPASQVITTFRTSEGGIMKNVLLDTCNVFALRKTYAELTQDFKDYMNHFTDPAKQYWLARDTSVPLANLYMYQGQGEATFKARYR